MGDWDKKIISLQMRIKERKWDHCHKEKDTKWVRQTKVKWSVN